MSHTFRRFAPSSLTLRVRIDPPVPQRTIFSGAENLTVSRLSSELSLMISELRVRSFTMRNDLEHVTSALQLNLQCGFWPLAQRAALDLAALLAQSGRRHLADPELCSRGANAALRISELCAQEVR